MPDDGKLLDVVGLPDFFIDGFANYALIDGILRCTGFRRTTTDNGIELVPIVNLFITPAGAIEARAKAFDALHALGEMPNETISKLRGLH